MNYFQKFSRIVAIKQMSNDKEAVVDQWHEARSFDAMTPVSEIIDWAKDATGDLIITIDQEGAKRTTEFKL